jgi:hypothetical protein
MTISGLIYVKVAVRDSPESLLATTAMTTLWGIAKYLEEMSLGRLTSLFTLTTDMTPWKLHQI